MDFIISDFQINQALLRLRKSLYNSIWILTFISIQYSSFAQNKSDYIWLGGVNNASSSGIEGFMLDFNDNKVDVKPVNSALQFDMNNVSMCDEEGNLLFYSNGCAIANANHEIMENGEGINAGDFFDILWLGNCDYGYPGYQDILSIKNPNVPNSYFVITTPVTLDIGNGDTYKYIIQYSEVDIDLNDGLGAVTIKNEVIKAGVEILVGYMTAIGTSDDSYWILNVTTNPISFIKTKIDSSGIYFHDQQFIGINLDEDYASASGTAAFSPQGDKYAIFNKYDQLHIFDFDTETGLLSNHNLIDVSTDDNIFSSIEFSSNGRFLYVSTQLSVYQVDLYPSSGNYEIELIDEFNGVQNPQNANMFLLRRGPDCRIYIAASGASDSYGIINYPNRKGKDCELVQQGIDLPYITGVVSLPNFPNYRINEEAVCDSTIVGVYSAVEELKQQFMVYPNPALDYVNILLPEYNLNGRVEIHNNYGQLISKEFISGYEMSLDVSGLESGYYYVTVISDNKRLKSEPLIIIE